MTENADNIAAITRGGSLASACNSSSSIPCRFLRARIAEPKSSVIGLHIAGSTEVDS